MKITFQAVGSSHQQIESWGLDEKWGGGWEVNESVIYKTFVFDVTGWQKVGGESPSGAVLDEGTYMGVITVKEPVCMKV